MILKCVSALLLSLFTHLYQCNSDTSISYNTVLLAGNGLVGSTNGKGNQASFYMPMGLEVTDEGFLFVSDSENNQIRRISIVDGSVSTVAGSTASQFSKPWAIAYYSNRLYVCDHLNNRIRVIQLSNDEYGKVSDVLGSDGAPVQVDSPTGIAIDKQGNIYVTSKQAHSIFKINSVSGKKTVVAGSVSAGKQDGVGTVAEFREPTGIEIDKNDEFLYISDSGNFMIRRLDLISMQVTTLMVDAQFGLMNLNPSNVKSFNGPSELRLDKQGNLYFVEQNQCSIIMLQPGVAFRDIVKNPNGCSVGGSGSDGSVLDSPYGLTIDINGNLYVSERYGHRILKIVVCHSNEPFQSTTSSCLSCSPGSFYNSTLSTCSKCPLGNYKNLTGIQSCIPCPVGLYSSNDRTSCLQCPNSAVCNGLGEVSCYPGFEWDQDNEECTQCKKDYYKGETSVWKCTRCPLGSFANSSYTGCLKCPTGYYKPSFNYWECIKCPSGSQCIEGEIQCLPGFEPNASLEVPTQCNPCMNNQIKPSIGNSPCQTCPLNSYSNHDGTNCLKCAKGSYEIPNPRVGSSCKSCPVGEESNLDRSGCVACQNGYYRASESWPDCLKCPVNSTCTAIDFTCNLGLKRLQNTCVDADKSSGDNENEFVLENKTRIIIFIVILVCLISGAVAFGCRRMYCATKTVRTDSSKDFESVDFNSKSSLSQSKAQSTLTENTTNKNSSRISTDKSKEVTTNNSSQSWATTTTIIEYAGLCIPGFLLLEKDEDFRIDRKLCHGGGGIVYLGSALSKTLLQHGKRVVIKEFYNEQLRRLSADIFYQEVSMMYMFRDHPNIAKILGFSELPHCLIMKYHKHGSLMDWLDDKEEKKTKRLLRRFIKDISTGIQYMAEKGVAHCDLKTANVLIDEDDLGNLKCVLADFGLACLVNDDALNVKGFRIMHIKGFTLQYASPEAIKKLRASKSDQNKYSYHPLTSDIFSLAIIIFSVVTREKIWKYSNNIQ